MLNSRLILVFVIFMFLQPSPVGHCRHYVFDPSVCLSVRAYMRAQWSHSPTGLPSISSYFIYIFMQAD